MGGQTGPRRLPGAFVLEDLAQGFIWELTLHLFGRFSPEGVFSWAGVTDRAFVSRDYQMQYFGDCVVVQVLAERGLLTGQNYILPTLLIYAGLHVQMAYA